LELLRCRSLRSRNSPDEPGKGESADETKLLASEPGPSAEINPEEDLEALEVSGDAVRHSLGVARGTTSALGAGVKLLDESAEVRIGLPSILSVGGVYKLVAVVVHLHSTARANHLVSLGHSSHPCLLRSVQRYLLTTLA